MLAVAVLNHGRTEGVVELRAAAELRRERLRERRPVAFDRKIDVEARLAEQDVAHGAADEVDAAVFRNSSNGVEHRPQPLERLQL